MNGAVVTVAILLFAGGLTGCSATTQQILPGNESLPPGDKEAINLGTNLEVGDVDVGNLILVTRGE